MVILGKAERWHGIANKQKKSGIEVGMKKKILIAVLVIALAITSVVALVACDNTNLDGKYIQQGQENWYLLIEGESIKLVKENTDESQKILESGTFTIEDNELKVTGFEDEYKFEISKDKKTIIMKSVNLGGKTIFNKES